MSISSRKRDRAMRMRSSGSSLSEIAIHVGIAKSTASLWLRDVSLLSPALEIIRNKKIVGHTKGRLMIAERRKLQEIECKKEADRTVQSFAKKIDKHTWQLVAALLFWCEGSKQLSGGVRFTNSDPRIIKTFLFALRHGFVINESSLHCLVHIHDYHDEQFIVRFWSSVTSIPISKFYNSYKKPHTGHRKHHDYKGCLSVRYSDANLAKMVSSLYDAFAKNIGA